MNGELLKRWLLEQNMRPEQLALKLKVSFSTVQNMMAGKRVYSSTVTLLSQLTGIPENELTGKSPITHKTRKALMAASATE